VWLVGEECSVEAIRGSPATLVVRCSGDVYVVDPGHGRKRAKQLAKLLRGSPRVVIYVTHHHSDHHAVLAEGLLDTLRSSGAEVRVAATRRDAPGLRDPLIRVVSTFGYPLRPDSSILPFRAPGVPVDLEVEPPGSLGPLELIPLPGHTPGQAGVIAPDGTFYAADALFGERVLERYGVPYHLDPCLALETLDDLERVLPRVEAVQPSHGPRLPSSEAAGLIEANRRAIQKLLDAVRDSVSGEPQPAQAVAARIARASGARAEPGMLMLVEATVRGALSCLHSRGLVEPVSVEGMVSWRLVRA
jgi:glyoxylase-like metal-dependent hydrolase (beta-lactamase superfamily II)